MSIPQYIKTLKDNGINCSTDGLLIDWIGRGNYRAAIGIIEEHIVRRREQITVLSALRSELWQECIAGDKKKIGENK